MKSYHGIGAVSGPSMDGLDLCFATFTLEPKSDVWTYRLEQAVTVPYRKALKRRLASAVTLSGIELIRLQLDWSHFLGQCLEKFIQSQDLHPDFASSHGHTVINQPENALFFQIGDGEIVSSYLECPFVCDFLSKDIALGGEGRAMVTCGDRFLQEQTDFNIVLGPVAEVSFQGNTPVCICPCTKLLNRLATAHRPDLASDPDLALVQGGQLASHGEVIPEVLEELNRLKSGQGHRPEDCDGGLEDVVLLMKTDVQSMPDLMRTCTEHICQQIQQACARNKRKGLERKYSARLSGAGVKNKTLKADLKAKFLANRIQVVDPEQTEVSQYKEAVVFAFLGLRALLGLDNVFTDLTGSKLDAVAGSIHRGRGRRSNTPGCQGSQDVLGQNFMSNGL